jgi:hypothetical protein
MRILFTFDYDDCSIRACDLACFFIHYGHEVSFFNLTDKTRFILYKLYKLNKIKIETDYQRIKDYDIWLYESTDWNNDLSKFVDYMTNFKGILVNINLEDGSEFYIHRVGKYVADKTRMFINHSFHMDKERYRSNYYKQANSILDRIFLTTSFITNSQEFSKINVKFEDKIRRIIFTGSLTGGTSHLTNFSDKEYRLRADFVEEIYKHKEINSILCFHSYDPNLKELYDSIDPHLRQNIPRYNREDFLNMFSKSLISLSLKGNSFPTNRFFESQAAGCVILSNEIKSLFEIYGIGEENVDYVTLKIDGSDLIEKIKYYLDESNSAESKKLCENSRKIWEMYNKLDENWVYPEKTREYHKTGFETMLGIKL